MTDSAIAVVLPDIRSAQNVGSILRTADAIGAELVITCGYTPHPTAKDDLRPPHVADANLRAIAKTALGAERSINLMHFSTYPEAIDHLRHNNFTIVALEQSEASVPLFSYAPVGPMALIVGNEVTGLSKEALRDADAILELPMVGLKESLNVAVAAGIALYQLRFGKNS